MKKILFRLFVIMTVLVSCTDQEDIDIVYRTEVNVAAEHIFDDYVPFQEGDFDMTKDGWKLNLQVLIYDEQGALVDKTEKLCSSLSEVLVYDEYMKPGNYTILSIADFRDGLGGSGYKFWNIENENDIQSISITENGEIYPVVFETLGIDVQNITITDRKEITNVNVKPITSLVEVFMSDKDYTGWGIDGYSRFSVLSDGYFIKALKFKNNIRVVNGNLEYKYSEQISDYNIAISNVHEKWTQKQAPTDCCYRALLPETNKGFTFHIQKRELPDEFYNVFVQLSGEFEADGKSNVLPEIKSNTQYVVNMIFDALQLVAFEYTDNFSHEGYTMQFISDYSRKLIDEMVWFGYEEIVGLSESAIKSYLQAEARNSVGTVAYYDRSPAWRFESYITIRYTEETRNKSNRIMLQLPIMDNEMVEYLVKKLEERYTPYSHVGNVYQFTDKATVKESNCGIILDIRSKPDSPLGSNDNICLFFDAIK